MRIKYDKQKKLKDDEIENKIKFEKLIKIKQIKIKKKDEKKRKTT
jgi:hypothetical protein